MLHENVEAFVQAFSVDLRKPRFEVLTGEIGPIARRATQSVALLDEWASDESIPVPDQQKSWSPTVLKRPKGVVLIVSCVSIVSLSYIFAYVTRVRKTLELPCWSQPAATYRRHSRRMPSLA
jgi:hypothetical protein